MQGAFLLNRAYHGMAPYRAYCCLKMEYVVFARIKISAVPNGANLRVSSTKNQMKIFAKNSIISDDKFNAYFSRIPYAHAS